VVTVALDTPGAKAARRWIEMAEPSHPSLIDQAHVVDELFGIVNVPMGVWIDEAGMIVRPAEPAWPGRPGMSFDDIPVPDDLPEILRDTLAEAKKIKAHPEEYAAAVRAWVADGSHALSPDEVVARSRPRGTDAATAAASFELGQHLHLAGHVEAAQRWFREAHRLQPENWTYKRQAWSMVDRNQGRTDVYDSSWLDDVRAIGAENYYAPLNL
jgi:hypothetical protein